MAAQDKKDQRALEMYELYEQGATLEEIGICFGLTRERVRQIFMAAGLYTRTHVEAAGISRHAQGVWPKRYSDAELIECLRQANSGQSGPLAGYAYDDYATAQRLTSGRSWPSRPTYIKRFGTWRDALKAAGVPANRSSMVAVRVRFNRDQCLDAICRVASKLGKTPTVREYEHIAQRSDSGLPSTATVRNRCGGWTKAITEAGLIGPE